MKKYLSKISLLLFTALVGAGAVSCSDKEKGLDGGRKYDDYNMSLDTRALPASITNNIVLQMFHHGGASDQMFKRTLTYQEDNGVLYSQVETGNWDVTMISPPAGVQLVAPTGGVTKDELPMYVYNPSVVSYRSENAPEIYTSILSDINMTPDGTYTAGGEMSRNVAKVELVIKSATPNFDLTPNTAHKITLHNVPSTITYAGTLYPDGADPDVLTGGLEARLKMKQSTAHQGYYDSEQVDFIIPGHKGTGFTHKMAVTVELLRAGGSWFKKTEILPVPAHNNQILHVGISVSDGMEFTTSVKPWDEVTLDETVGEGYSNWLYVKKGGTGTGQSWLDAAGSITQAIGKAVTLQGKGRTVHGILVAGGDSNVYEEAFTVPNNLRVFGGWTGLSGSELIANDPDAPYTSSYRNLKDYKATVNVGTGKVDVRDGLLDGFVIKGADVDHPILYVGTDAYANAIRIEGQQRGSSGFMFDLEGTASNMLIADNNRGVNIDGGTLINSTVVNSGGHSYIMGGGTIYNSVFWNSELVEVAADPRDIRYSAFVGEIGTIPAGINNYHINAVNNAWFSTSVTAPGPHFKLDGSSTQYQPGHKRSPLLSHADATLFDSNAGFPAGAAKDIDGNTRYFPDPTDAAKNVMDIGCYEQPDGGLEGFRLMWLSDKMYISAKGGYVNNLPLLIPNNDDTDLQVEVNWTATALSSSSWSTFNGATSIPGINVVVGSFQFTNYGVTPTNDYKENSERSWGKIKISTNLGGYMPDAEIEILQVPGASAEWEDGYAGSFHRNNERGARYISGRNTGNWSARVLSGLEWIKIDTKGKYEGADIMDDDEGITPEGLRYKEVEEVWGGYVTGTGNIKFRVGMKSKNTTGSPRYGLILITRGSGGGTGGAMFFVRQGEDPDYLYRAGDTRRVNVGTEANPNYQYWERTQLAKFAVYNVTDPAGNTNAAGSLLSQNTSGFVKYPTQIGYYFRWNQQTALLQGKASSTGTTITPWSNSREVCPVGYRHPNYLEYNHTIYYNVNDNTSVSPNASDSALNFQWGAYADGFYDQLAPDPIPELNIVCTNPTTPGNKDYSMLDTRLRIGTAEVAHRGALMVSHYNYASIFFPAGGMMNTTGALLSSSFNWSTYCFYPTTSSTSVNTHWTYGHIGMSCTYISSYAVPVRCVEGSW